MGFNVLHADLDAIWFRDPLPYLLTLGAPAPPPDISISSDKVSTSNPADGGAPPGFEAGADPHTNPQTKPYTREGLADAQQPAGGAALPRQGGAGRVPAGRAVPAETLPERGARFFIVSTAGRGAAAAGACLHALALAPLRSIRTRRMRPPSDLLTLLQNPSPPNTPSLSPTTQKQTNKPNQKSKYPKTKTNKRRSSSTSCRC